MRPAALLLILPLMAQSASYTAQRIADHGMETVRLTDSAHATEVSIVPSIGNMAYSMKIHGKDILYFPFHDLTGLRDKPTLCGVPFLAPWANRIAGMEFWANGKKYFLNGEVGSLRKDGNGNPIHGVLNHSPYWEIVRVQADEQGASVTSKLEFWQHPELMAQWPFAHEYEMTYRLANGTLQVETVVRNKSTEAMPVSIGYHPYFTLPEVPRDEWVAHLSATKSVLMDSKLVATGELQDLVMRDIPIATHPLDNGFTGLVGGDDGNAEFSVTGRERKISVIYGPKYTVAVAYAPPGKDFICFEPMTAVTNGVNLFHEGKYPALQSVAAGAEWRESFWVKVSGF